MKLKLLNFDQLIGTADSFEKTLMLGKIEDRKEEQETTEGVLVGWHH